MMKIEKILVKELPDMILVHGDTTTSFAGALAAFYNQVAIGHVEAGLRTDDKYSPFPEEMNRQMVGVLADLHFAPTEKSRENLLREGMATGRGYVFATSNCVYTGLDLARYEMMIDLWKQYGNYDDYERNFGNGGTFA